MQYWFNGTLVLDRHDILFRTGARPSINFHQFLIAPYIGDRSPADQYMWIDDLLVATGIPIAPPPPASAAVASVTVSPSSASVLAAGEYQFTATLKDSSGTVVTGPPVVWASKDSAVATVSGSGLARAVAAGYATITATSGAVTGTAVFTVTAGVTNPATVTDLSVTSVTDTAVTLAFTEVNDGTGRPASYDIRGAAGAFSWGSAADVARGTCAMPVVGTAVGAKRGCTVGGLAPATTYRFTLVAFRGTLNLDAVFGGLSNVALGSTALAPAPVASVAVTPVSASLALGATQQLTASVKDSAGIALTGGTVTWASSVPAVATVSGSGLVTAVAAGSAMITATSEGVQGVATVAVTASATKPGTVTDLAVAGVTDSSITLSFTEVNDGAGLPAGYDIRFGVAPLEWGLATDVAQGSCQVPLAGSAIGAKLSCTVLGLASATSYQFQLVAFWGTLNVSAVFGALSNVAAGTTAAKGAPAPAASVTVTPASASLAVGATQQLNATLKDASGTILTGRTITWASSSPAVATVTTNGLVTARAAGTTTITATAEGVQGAAGVTVTAPTTKPGTVTGLAVAAVTVSSVTLTFTEVNDGTGLPASYVVQFAVPPLGWGSAKDVSLGTCHVPLAGTAIGATRSCTVLGLAASTSYQFQLVAFRGTLNVNAVFGGLSNVVSGTTAAATAPVATVSVSPATATVGIGGAQQLTATLRDASGLVLTGRTVTWASSNVLVATVNGSGLASGLVVGTATITATSEGQSGPATLTVALLPPPPAGWPNEPAGFTLLSDYGFDALVPATNQGDLLGGGWRVWWNTAGRGTHALDATAPWSPADVFQVHYPIGFPSGLEPTMLEYLFPLPTRPTELYWGFWWKPSNPFQSDPSGVNKIAFIWTPSGKTDLLYFDLSPNPWRIRGMDDLIAGGGPDAGKRNEPNVTTTVITLGQWHRIEIYVKYSTGTSANGILKWWVDGVLNGNYTNLKMVQDGGFDHVQFAPTYGGNTGAVKTENDYYWYDHVRLSRP
jgi:uncharacterized protein YjdB